jgi:hypothetical protein
MQKKEKKPCYLVVPPGAAQLFGVREGHHLVLVAVDEQDGAVHLAVAVQVAFESKI